MLVSCCAGEVAQQLERVIFKCSFNRLGALLLDKEFRELSSYLSSIASWNIREKYSRLSNVREGGGFFKLKKNFFRNFF